MVHNKKILLVEDESTLRQPMAFGLRDEGFTVIEAENGEEGLEFALKEKPDLILLDLIMPIVDGMAVLRELRKNAWGKEVPVILLTNLNETEKITEAVESKVYEYLVKSDWSLDDVVKKIKEKLGIK